MFKALFLDMDETLCDTSGANNKALAILANQARERFPDFFADETADDFAQAYIRGIYRRLTPRYEALLLPALNEEQFRMALIQLILSDMGLPGVSQTDAAHLQRSFDDARTQYFDFFPGIKAWLMDLRSRYKLVVITNGPEYSQVAKVDRVNLRDLVDEVLIGGLEPEQKPAKSIFEKALSLVSMKAHEVLHIGDSLEADIQGANNAKIASVWISHGQDLPDDSVALPDHVIEHPLQLPQLITQLSG